MTIPTIAELSGNTVLELFENGYNAIKKDMKNKQDTLVAGDNIVIEGNVISAIEGGTPVLENYYTKQETDALLDDKADSSDVYDKEQIDDMLVAIGSEIPDMEYYYTKAETDDLLDAKANSNNVYSKTEVDSKLLLKANTTDVYNKSEVYAKVETYNKSEVYSKSEVYDKTEVNSLLNKNYVLFTNEDWSSLFEAQGSAVSGNQLFKAKHDIIVKINYITESDTNLETIVEFKKNMVYLFKVSATDKHWYGSGSGAVTRSSTKYYGRWIGMHINGIYCDLGFANDSSSYNFIAEKVITESNYFTPTDTTAKAILYYKED